MANVLFTRKNASEIPNVPITDGQLIFDTSGNGKMYLDNGTERLEMGGAMTVDSVLNAESTNPIQNKAVAGVMLKTLGEVGAVTKAGFIPDALTVKQLNNNLTTTSNEPFRFDKQDGKYGYIAKVEGADTFFPFNGDLKIKSSSSGNYKKGQTYSTNLTEAKKGDIIIAFGSIYSWLSSHNISATNTLLLEEKSVENQGVWHSSLSCKIFKVTENNPVLNISLNNGSAETSSFQYGYFLLGN